MSGPAAAEARAAETAEINEVQARADEAAMGVIQEQALADNRQFDRDQRAQERAAGAEADKQAAIQERIDMPGMVEKDADGNDIMDAEGNPKPTVRALNYQAEREIFGSRGETSGYVDDEGKPLTKPELGIVDQIRGVGVADEVRENRRYGTTPEQRNAVADDYESRQGERDARAQQYVSGIEELQAEGFELTQAKLINDLAEEISDSQRQLYGKLMAHALEGRDPAGVSPEEMAGIRGEAVDRVITHTVRGGDDLNMLKRVIKKEGLFSREEYDQFRYKQGNPKRGEKKQFTKYRQESIDSYKDHKDQINREDLVNSLEAKDQLRQERADAKADAEADAAARREEEEEEPPVEPTEPHPIVDPSPSGLRERARNLMYGTAAYIGAKMHRMGEYFSDDEKGRRRKGAAAVAGALVLAGVAYLELKGVSTGGSRAGDVTVAPGVKPHHHDIIKHSTEHYPAATSTDGGTSQAQVQEHVRSSTDGGTTVPQAGKPKATTELQPGQNPWTVSEHRLHELGNAHPTATQIEHFDQEMAKLNPDKYHYFGDSSEEMPVGTKLVMPR